MAWYLYIAQCRDRSLYAGVTTDPARRLAEHNAGAGSKYVRSRRPAALVYVERCRSRAAAQRRERAIHGWPRARKLVLIQSRGRHA